MIPSFVRRRQLWTVLTAGPLVTLAMLVFLELMRTFVVRIPNPVGFYVIAVTVSAFFGGMWIGLLSALLTLLYGVFIDFDPSLWFTTSSRIAWLVVMVAVLPSVAVLVGLQRFRLAQERRTLARKTAEKEALARELAAANNLLVDAIQSMQEGFALYDRDDRLVICNDKYKALVSNIADAIVPGAAYADILHRLADVVVIDEGPAARERWIEKRLMQHRYPRGTQRVLLASGPWVEFSEHPTRDGGVVAIRRDITDRIRREQDLIDRDAHSRAILDNVIGGVITIDEAGRIIVFNPSAERMFGYSAAEVAGKNVNMLMPEPHRSQHDGYVARYLSTGKPRAMGQRTKVPGKTKDGRVFPMQLGLGEYRLAGRRIFIASVQDLTESEALEAQLRQAHKMEAVGQLTGGLAHDFNNLLTIIVSNLELLSNKPEPGEASAALVEAAMKAGLRGAELTQRLLAFSRRQALQPRALSVNHLVASVAALLKRTLGQQVAIQTLLPEEVWNVFADPGQLENAIVNLAVNARDAMPQGGTLLFETGNTQLDGNSPRIDSDAAPGEYAVITVKDNGAGMPADVLRRAWDPFFTTKEPGKGTGLGLSMVYGFIKQSGGHVNIESAPGQGTTVRLFLPRNAGPAAQPMLESRAESLPDGQGRAVLLVEDDPDVQRAAKAMLTDMHYAVFAAAGAEHALTLLRQHPEIRLLFSDVMLQGEISGVSLAQRARSLRPALRVLLTSGYPEQIPGKLASPESGFAFIHKPYRREQLARLLGTL